MKTIVSAVFVAAIVLCATEPRAAVSTTTIYGEEIVEHGGGCRKSSPPGKCCHMDRKKGVVHCH